MNILKTGLIAAALATLSVNAFAQNYPSKPIRWVVPYTPGGYTDNVTRIVTAKVQTILGQPIIIENKPGANSIIGVDFVAKAAPDGYTILTVITAHAANATLYEGKLPFDHKALSPVSLVAISPLILTTSKQFPAILYQVLQEVETEGYACREIYCDTFKVNFSAAAEEVAAMFKVKLVPISAGTPQEMAYAENAVKTIAAMSRSLMAGAPHLKGFCWGLADLHAANVHHVMPQQSRNNMSPYEYKLKREPDRDALFIHVFGCPVQYEPYGGALHKRAPKTEWGYYVGVQWPMVLVMREADWKVRQPVLSI